MQVNSWWRVSAVPQRFSTVACGFSFCYLPTSPIHFLGLFGYLFQSQSIVKGTEKQDSIFPVHHVAARNKENLAENLDY